MFSLKDKVSNQLSRLFADSPNSNSSSPSSSSSSSTVSPTDQNPQVSSYTKEGKSFTSYFSYVVPSFNFGGSKTNEPQIDTTSPPPVKWDSQDFKLDDEYLLRYNQPVTAGGKEFRTIGEDDKKHGVVCRNEERTKAQEVYDDAVSVRTSSDSDIYEEAHDHPTPQKTVPVLLDESAFISPDLYEFLYSSIPNIVKGCQWSLLYRQVTFALKLICPIAAALLISHMDLDSKSFCQMKGSTSRHGISLRTLIRKSADLPGPCLLIVGDKQGAVFGGLLECPLKPTAKRKYQGTNQSFVFTTIYGEPRLFRPTGANRYYYICMNDLLALGGGGDFALCLDGDLLNGTSGPSDTFGNLCLAHKPEFELKNVELWGFTHLSRYLT